MVRYSDLYDKLSGPEGEGGPGRPEPDPAGPPDHDDVGPTSRFESEAGPEDRAEAEDPVEPSGVSDVERDVLGELTGLGMPDPDQGGERQEPEPVEPETPARPVSDDQMFDELDAAVSAPAEPVEVEVGPASAMTEAFEQDQGRAEEVEGTAVQEVSVPVEGPLTEAETVVREEVLHESDRVLHEEVPHMFAEQTAVPGGPAVILAEEDADSSGVVSKLVALPMEVLNLPARWLGPAVVTGLGLAGIFLLIALFVVILVQAILG